jgi:hypothetical protein
LIAATPVGGDDRAFGHDCSKRVQEGGLAGTGLARQEDTEAGAADQRLRQRQLWTGHVRLDDGARRRSLSG